MLHPVVYRKMYDLVRGLPDLSIVEIGGGSGAGSVAIACALKDFKKKHRLIVVEKCEGGSRTTIGDYQHNLRVITKNFARFGVLDNIVLFPEALTFKNGAEVVSLIETPRIAALIHDADGRVDRDFYFFWPLLDPGGPIIVDDYASRAKYLPITEQHPTGGMKCLITYRLLNQLMEWGLFKMAYTRGRTVFGYKPLNSDFSALDLSACEKIVQQIELERVSYLDNKKRISTNNVH